MICDDENGDNKYGEMNGDEAGNKNFDKNEKYCGILCGCYSARVTLTGPMEQIINYPVVRNAEYWYLKTPDHSGMVRLPYLYLIVCKGEAMFDWRCQNYDVAIAASNASAILNDSDAKRRVEGENLGSGRRIVINLLSVNIPVAV